MPAFPPALRHAPYRRYLFGAFVSNVGNMLQSTAIAMHLFDLTHSSFKVGLLGLVRVGPLLVFSLIGGIVADHKDRRKVVLATQCAMGAIALALTLVEWRGYASVPAIYVTVGLLAVTTSFDNPARQAMVVNLVPHEDLRNAIGLNGISWRLSDIVGPAIAGAVLKSGGLAGLGRFGTSYLINFLTFGAVIVAVLMLPPLPSQGQTSNRPQNLKEIVEAIRDGLRFVHGTRVLRSSLWIDFWATFFSGADALLPAFAKDILKVGDAGYALLRASMGAGALLGALVMTWYPVMKRQGRWVIIMVGLYGLSTILFGVSMSLPLAMLFLAGTGFADMVSTVLRQTIRQLTTPDHMRGRMTATSVLFHATGPQLGDMEAGTLAKLSGERWSIVVGGTASVLLALWWGRGGALREYEFSREKPAAA